MGASPNKGVQTKDVFLTVKTTTIFAHFSTFFWQFFSNADCDVTPTNADRFRVIHVSRVRALPGKNGFTHEHGGSSRVGGGREKGEV